MKQSLDGFGVTAEFTQLYLEALDCPRALTVLILFREKEYSQLIELDCVPTDFDILKNDRFADSLAATKLLSKNTFLETGRDKRQVAIDKFKEAERQCQVTNTRILSGTYNCIQTPTILSMAQRKIQRVLGTFPCCELLDACDWGPGSTISLPRRSATHPQKYLTESGITSEAYDFIAPWFSLAYPTWVSKNWEIQNANKVVTVPKNAKTDRVIAIEPGINLWFQKGIGTLLRRKLTYSGLDLNHGQQRHAEFIRPASIYGHLCTVDFSSASDTISSELVRELLPREWYLVMAAFRSKTGSLDGERIIYNKFSSMGNGYTFELESLIFWALADSVCKYLGISGTTSAYGDDVILPTNAYRLYRDVCEDCGFTINEKKSYSTSYYRESCGAHYHNGYDVKPIFLKEPLYGTTALLKTVNNVRRLSHRRVAIGCDKRFRTCWSYLSGILGPKTPRISEGYGDIGIIENIDDASVSVKRAPNGYEGYLVKLWVVCAHKQYIEHEGLLPFKLKTIGGSCTDFLSQITEPSSIGNNVPIPIRTRRAKVRVLVPTWYDLGRWL